MFIVIYVNVNNKYRIFAPPHPLPVFYKNKKNKLIF